MSKRFFTLEEARGLLPTIRNLVQRAVQISSLLEKFLPEAKRLAEASSADSGSSQGTQYLFHLIALQSCLSEIEKTGALIKGVQEGLVDFPHLRDGREVYLCWRLGEDDIEYWHEVDAGFAGRVPITKDH